MSLLTSDVHRADSPMGIELQRAVVHSTMPSGLSRMSAKAKFCDERVWHFSQVLPALVRWRMLVFYAPFFCVMDFPIRKNTKAINFNYRGTDPKARAHHAARALLRSVSRNLSSIDVDAVLKERQQGALAQKPIHQDLKKVSALTGIATRQLHRAIALYAQYLELLQQSLLSVDTSNSETLKAMMDQLTASGCTAPEEYSNLAKILLEDHQDYSDGRILEIAFPGSQRERMNELNTICHALTKCKHQFFDKLEYRAQRMCLWPGVRARRDGTYTFHVRNDSMQYDFGCTKRATQFIHLRQLSSSNLNQQASPRRKRRTPQSWTVKYLPCRTNKQEQRKEQRQPPKDLLVRLKEENSRSAQSQKLILKSPPKFPRLPPAATRSAGRSFARRSAHPLAKRSKLQETMIMDSIEEEAEGLV